MNDIIQIKCSNNEVINMVQTVIFFITLLSTAIWIAVSREAIKPTKEINWRKMTALLFTGSLSTIIIVVSLFQHL